jgi:hypothetical protein
MGELTHEKLTHEEFASLLTVGNAPVHGSALDSSPIEAAGEVRDWNPT